MRRAVLALFLAAPLVVAGCGGEGVVEPTAKAVEGTLPQQTSTLPKGNPASGKTLFAKNGCGGCHTYKPAGSNAKIGPDLDNLAKYAKQAKQQLEPFTRESIVNPKAYVQPGFQPVMPSFASLPKDQVDALVAFLTKKS